MRPDERHLVGSIVAAFDRLPEPELARLEALERRLSRRLSDSASAKKPRARFWWLLAGLVATGAAAWWGGEYLRGTDSRPVPRFSAPNITAPSEHQDQHDSARESGSEKSSDASSESETGSQTIYRREVY